ncbi:glycosyl hydrolase family 95 catalytic domain-containing protein [Actinorugispora endophytica]|uniref:Glycosyl hydrolase family 65 n=1 Tax=Actinorugispora endophytica TaxID=1605990 RepID=A0A4V3D882_9ACTN|nr:glycoside hydrolase N-terminal domain-containing protein [Actinorugispora endophytica]TDQ50777.1 glycosyl hydrolase family 65 [Actinorugispora endophytica]
MTGPERPPGVHTRLPAADWEDALVTGNGRQGALVHAVAGLPRATLCHERLFWPVEEPLAAPDTAGALPELRALLRAGRAREAAARVVGLAEAGHPGYARTRWIDPLTGAGTLVFTPDGEAGEGGVSRRCDHAGALVTEELPGGLVHEVFASRADDVVVLRLRARGGLDGTLSLTPVPGEPPSPATWSAGASPGRLLLRAAFARRWPGAPAGYALTCRVVARGGGLRWGADAVRVSGAAELLVLARTSVARPGEEPPGPDDSLAALPADFAALLARHAPLHAELFDRARIRLTPPGRPGEPGSTAEDLLAAGPGPELVERLVDAGRYAVICASGELPPTLQGVWSGAHAPPWSSGYTLDGNLASAVAALHPTGVPELMTALFDLVEPLVGDFAENARRLYGCRGVLLPAHLSTHGRHNHFGPEWCLTFWTAGAAWIARLYWDHYSHTGDTAFLRERALPFMTAAAEFYEDFLTEEGFTPSYSPENTPADSDGQAAANATMDVAAARDLVRNLLRAHRVLGIGGARRWARLALRLPGYRISPEGALAEWAGPAGPVDQADNHAHRHASHLFPFWYEGDPAFADPALRAAAVRAVRARLAWWRGQEADEMAFGLVQLGLAAAHLGLAEEANETLELMAARYWRPTLVSTHNRGALFNVDICGGLPAVVAAMLVRSREGRVDLLPALPAGWPRGRARGLRARGGVVVRRLEWEPGGFRAELTALAPRRVRVGLPDGTSAAVDLAPGRVRPVRAGLPG